MPPPLLSIPVYKSNFPRFRALMLANNEIVMKEMERRWPLKKTAKPLHKTTRTSGRAFPDVGTIICQIAHKLVGHWTQ